MLLLVTIVTGTFGINSAHAAGEIYDELDEDFAEFFPKLRRWSEEEVSSH